jgi:hypothetical protein
MSFFHFMRFENFAAGFRPPRCARSGIIISLTAIASMIPVYYPFIYNLATYN